MKRPASVITTLILFGLFIISGIFTMDENSLSGISALLVPILVLIGWIGVFLKKNWARVYSTFVIIFFGLSILVLPFITKVELNHIILIVIIVPLIFWWAYSLFIGKASKKYFQCNTEKDYFVRVIKKGMFSFIKSKKQKYFEKDNIGTRIDTSKKSRNLYSAWVQQGMPQIGSIHYKFDNKKDAYSAILEIPCIKKSEDMNKLICLEVLNFGVYFENDNNCWIAFLSGVTLNEETYNQAKASFEKYNGKEISVSSTIKENVKISKSKDKTTNKISVEFSQEIDLSKQGGIGTKKIYKAPNKASAIEFLKNKNIKESYFYIEIETPEGWVGKDKEGMYEF